MSGMISSAPRTRRLPDGSAKSFCTSTTINAVARSYTATTSLHLARSHLALDRGRLPARLHVEVADGALHRLVALALRTLRPLVLVLLDAHVGRERLLAALAYELVIRHQVSPPRRLSAK